MLAIYCPQTGYYWQNMHCILPPQLLSEIGRQPLTVLLAGPDAVG